MSYNTVLEWKWHASNRKRMHVETRTISMQASLKNITYESDMTYFTLGISFGTIAY